MDEDGKALICLGERGLAFFFAAAVISFGLLLCLKPLLGRYTLAKPNARSSHKEPTPQGGGIAVIAATTIVARCRFLVFANRGQPSISTHCRLRVCSCACHGRHRRRCTSPERHAASTSANRYCERGASRASA